MEDTSLQQEQRCKREAEESQVPMGLPSATSMLFCPFIYANHFSLFHYWDPNGTYIILSHCPKDRGVRVHTYLRVALAFQAPGHSDWCRAVLSYMVALGSPGRTIGQSWSLTTVLFTFVESELANRSPFFIDAKDGSYWMLSTLGSRSWNRD